MFRSLYLSLITSTATDYGWWVVLYTGIQKYTSYINNINKEDCFDCLCLSIETLLAMGCLSTLYSEETENLTDIYDFHLSPA